MKKLAKFLKPFLLGVVLILILLFGQALCDLNLPNYMSDIVNVGIQQSGIEHASPDEVSEQGMALMQFFMTPEETALVGGHYDGPQPYTNSETGAATTAYVLRDNAADGSDTALRGRLDDAFGASSWALASSMIKVGEFMNILKTGLTLDSGEHAAPDQISVEVMTLLKNFIRDDQVSALIDGSYAIQFGGSAYNLRPEADRGMLDTVFAGIAQGVASAVPQLQQALADSANAAQTTDDSDSSALANLDVTQLYQMLPFLQMMYPTPEARLAAHDAAMTTDPMMHKQSGVVFAKGFYQELGVDVGKMQSDYIVHVGLLMLLIALAGGALTVLVSLLASRTAAGTARDLRHAIFNKVSSFSNNEYDKFSTASLITRSTNDITQIQMFLTFGLRMILYAPILATGGVIMAVRKSPSQAWILAMACIVLLGLIIVVFLVALPKFKIMQKLVDRLNLVSREHLSGLMVIRAFGAEEHEKDRFAGANRDLAKTTLFVNRVMVTMMPVMMLVMNGISLFIIWTGAHQIESASIQVGDMMAFIQYAMMVIMSFLMLSMMFIFVPRASVAAQRIAEVLETKPSIVEPANPEAFDESKKGLVEFRHVNFRYPGAEEDALHDIDFTALPGQTTAFIGSTGSGKSTAANLLLRFYDVTGGGILVDGADVRQVHLNDLRARIGYIPQQGVLLSGTIESNIKYGAPDISDEEMETAAEVAQAAEFISQMDHKFDEDIAQGGGNVSGGQKQRLSIARALAKKPEIFIFDDSFSALDFKTDRALRKALKEHTGGSTVLLVAQRVSTIMAAEQIIVLDEGRIVGKGTHRELLETCPQYLEIASSQLSKEELA